MRVIRPVEHADIAALMQLAGKTGGGLTSLPANEATLAARIERAKNLVRRAAKRRTRVCIRSRGQ